MQVRIRAAEPEDVPALVDIFSQPRVIWGTLQPPHVSAEARRKRLAANTDYDSTLLAEVEGRSVGMIGVHRTPFHRRSHSAALGMAVHDAFAGRGIGAALLNAAIDMAENWWGVRRLELDVYADNSRAIALYERHGFQHEGLHRAYAWRDGAFADTVTMARLRL